MTVARILRDKGREVASAQPHHSLRDVVAQLAERRVGALIVTDSTRAPLGIISERDVIRVLAAQGPQVLDDPVSKHMTRRVLTVSEDAAIDEVMATMTEQRFRHMPVVKNGAVVGIVSIGDIVARHVDALHNERQALKEYIASA
jgi:CBS domain-containing protein